MQNILKKKKNSYERYDKRIFSDLNSNLQASSCDESIESLHADSRCHVVIKALSYFKFENVNVLWKKNVDITINYPYVWYENKVVVKVSQQDELTKFLAFQLLD